MQQWKNNNEHHSDENKQPYIKEVANQNDKQTDRSKISFFVVLGILLILALIMGYQIFNNMSQVKALEEDLAANQEDLQVAEDYRNELNTYVSMLKDEDYVAKLARSEYYLTDEDDIVFNFINDDSSILSDVNESEEEMERESQEIEESQDS